ncbi:MAG: transposase [Syntrophaceae bacterium]|jgi:putative transposase|nr:transposase [Syntrophaceae bacterium]
MQHKIKPRLTNFDYRGCHRYFVTTCTDQKQPLFREAVLVTAAIAVLVDESQKHSFCVWGYCFMPDHLHLLLEGENENADMKLFVRVFKQKTGFAYGRQAVLGKLWQPGYYDHVLRRDEDLREVLKYIFNNPVRKGLVSRYADYPHLGSLALDVKTVMF